MRIRITPGAILLFLVMLLTKDQLFFAGVLAAAVHECGHLLAAWALGIRLQLLELDVGGARILPAGQLPSYRAEGLLAGAGPVASLLLAFIIPLNGAGFFLLLRSSTLSLALFNLLPITGFDGGRVLCALLSPRLGVGRAKALCDVCSYFSLLLLFSLFACLVLRYGESMLLGMLCAMLFARLFLL